VSKSIAFSAACLGIVLFVVTAYRLGTRDGRAERADLGIDPADAVRILEEEPYVVPAGRQLVITAVGTRQYTITEIGLEVDGERRALVMGDDIPDARYPVHAVATAGQRVRVFGGLIEDDALALGYLLQPPPGDASLDK